MEDLPTKLPTRVPIQTRFSDSDASGHINNVSYIAYFELARTRYFRDIYGGLNRFGKGWILGEVSCRYLAQAFFGDLLEVRCGVDGIGRASFRTAYEIVNTEKDLLVARGSSITVHFDFESQRAIRIDDDWKQRVSSHEGWDPDILS